MVQTREELSEVKSDYTHLETLSPACADIMSQENASVLSRTLTNAPYLIGVEDIQVDTIKLDAVREHFLDKLAQCVQKNNWAICLWSGITGLSRLWNKPRETP